MRWIFLRFFLFLIVPFASGQDISLRAYNEETSSGEKKLSPELLKQFQQKKIDKKSSYSLLLQVNNIQQFKLENAGSESIQINETYDASGAVQIKVKGEWLLNALKDANIQFVANARKPFVERELTGFDLSLNKVSAAHSIWPGINGEGFTVSVKEDLLDTLDIDFKGRYLSSSMASTNLQTHASTMATIAAGGGNTFHTGKGVAWGANISNANFSNLLPDNLSMLQQLKVGVQNHSYGVGIENYYGADAQAYDAQMNQDTSLMHVFSAGNMGNQTSTVGPYTGVPGYANITGSFKMSKNSLAVGATDLYNQLVPFSSKGPAHDGRVKPELVALGEDGSSGAAAIVSGVSLLLKNAWAKMNPLQPVASAALIKAVLINSADDMGLPNVDFSSGYGSLNAKRALQTIMERKVIQGKIDAAQEIYHPITVPANTALLKITLSWIDPPANPNTNKALVNDLDIELVQESTGNITRPWVLNHQPGLNSLQTPAVRGIDTINNTEQITISLPTAGNYIIKVRGAKLTTNQQAYTIAWKLDTLQHIDFTFPVKGTQLIAKQSNLIRWETNVTGTAVLQYRFNGNAWETLDAQVDLTKQSYQWNAPDRSGYLQFRLLTNTFEKQSDTVLMAPVITLQTGFNCADSFMLYWPRLSGYTYQLYKLGAKYLEPDLITTDTLVIKAKLNNPNEVYTVAPIIVNGFNSYVGYAQNYKQQQLECYIKGFVADPSGISNARLVLEIGSTYQVKRVEFEKMTSNGFQLIKTINPVTSKQISSIESANNGLNIYRAKLVFGNGQIQYSSPSSVLVFGEQYYYLFPNPLVQGNVLKLMSKEIDSTSVMIFDLSGRKVHQQVITGFIENISMPLLPKGMYYAIIQRAGLIQRRIPFIIL